MFETPRDASRADLPQTAQIPHPSCDNLALGVREEVTVAGRLIPVCLFRQVLYDGEKRARIFNEDGHRMTRNVIR